MWMMKSCFVRRRWPNLFNKLVHTNIKACSELAFLAPLKKEMIHVATVPSVTTHA